MPSYYIKVLQNLVFMLIMMLPPCLYAQRSVSKTREWRESLFEFLNTCQHFPVHNFILNHRIEGQQKAVQMDVIDAVVGF